MADRLATAAADSERMHALDGLRGTMMLLGLVLHGACSYMTVGLGKVWPYQDPVHSGIADFLVSLIHVFRMPIFFVLAGLFGAMLYGKRGASGLLKNRFQRIGIPFFVALLILFPMTNFAFIFANVAAKSGAAAAWSAVWATAQTAPPYLPTFTMHLWFLYYLLYFYVGAVLVAAACRSLPQKWQDGMAGAFRALVARPVLRVLVPGAVTALTLAPMRGFLVTTTVFIPDVWVVVAYGVFFGFGWLLYAQRDLIGGFTRVGWAQVVGAVALYAAVKFAVSPLFGADQFTGGALALWSLTGGVVAWMMFFGATGLFLRCLDKPSAVMRYIVDGSYWVYLVHLPFLLFLVGFLSGTHLNAGTKMLIVMSAATVFGFVTYDLFVRATFIGRSLNGQKYPRALSLPHVHAGVPTPAGR